MNGDQSNQPSEILIEIKLDIERHKILKKIADLTDLEDWQLILSYIQIGLRADTQEHVYDLLDLERESLNSIIDGIFD